MRRPHRQASNKLDSVETSVNYAIERATVTIPDGITVEDVVAEVEAIGYTARLPEATVARTSDEQSDGDSDPESERCATG